MKNLVQQIFSQLTVLSFSHRSERSYFWLCQCSCGKKAVIRADHLTSGHSRSCGCLQRKVATKHGSWKSTEYKTWDGLKQRCLNPNSKDFKRYGARGIGVAEEWKQSFRKFIQYVGRKPGREYSLDRINNDGNYEPGNVRWATPKQQADNRRRKYETSS